MENLFNAAAVNDYGYYSDRRKSISDAEPWEYVSADALEAAVDAHAVFFRVSIVISILLLS